MPADTDKLTINFNAIDALTTNDINISSSKKLEEQKKLWRTQLEQASDLNEQRQILFEIDTLAIQRSKDTDLSDTLVVDEPNIAKENTTPRKKGFDFNLDDNEENKTIADANLDRMRQRKNDLERTERGSWVGGRMTEVRGHNVGTRHGSYIAQYSTKRLGGGTSGTISLGDTNDVRISGPLLTDICKSRHETRQAAKAIVQLSKMAGARLGPHCTKTIDLSSIDDARLRRQVLSECKKNRVPYNYYSYSDKGYKAADNAWLKKIVPSFLKWPMRALNAINSLGNWKVKTKTAEEKNQEAEKNKANATPTPGSLPGLRR